ncbi:hypothetical protein HKD37_19G053745 [Glycine soja]
MALNENWNYSSSSNLETPINVSKNDTPTPLARLMGQNTTKRRLQVKGTSSSKPVVDLSAIEKEMKERNVVQKQITEIVESDNVMKLYDILMNDTSNMTEDQRKKHEITCNYILKNHKMARNSDFDRVWQHIIDEALKDNTDEEIMRYLYEHSRLMNDYFSKNCRVNFDGGSDYEKTLNNCYPYFQMRYDAFGRRGLSLLQKCTSTIRILAYGSPFDSVDEYVRIGESTVVECLKDFVKGVNEAFGYEYLRRLNNNDINRLLQIGETHEFLVAWQRQYRRSDHRKPTIILEIVKPQDLWILHAYFEVASSNNDINVFNNILQGRAPLVVFTINELHNMGYYLADDIYSD